MPLHRVSARKAVWGADQDYFYRSRYKVGLHLYAYVSMSCQRWLGEMAVRVHNKVIAFTLILMPAICQAAQSGNPELGLAYAREICAACHSVEMGAAVSTVPDAPSFESVANRPGVTAQSLDVWLQGPHPTMPNLQISTEERNHVISYILSLRTRP